MIVTDLEIPDLKLIEPQVFEDERGFFYESFNQQKLNDAIGKRIIFIQGNHSKSKRGVIRGLHYQEEPFAQEKLVRVVFGEVFDVVLDIRNHSPTYGKWFAITLSAKNKKQLWIPKGFAHGFLTLSNEAEVLYKITKPYNPKYEKTILYNDNDLKIDWPIKENIIISEKDKVGCQFKKIREK